ncbi:MAG: choice-of-anchor A family protein [Ignavibacteriales bacterium]|nr:choice-of-anchor A family protein [Ignavibacteriales bacterium]MCF8316294.1 choice-of-anchor A family protein [Ignavibacteriales bacterium]MCF8437878.1 choice-of-anchor A family protein [Ignavibacteriales bacterium]
MKRTIFTILLFITSIASGQNFQTLGTWNDQGVPNYLEPAGDNVSAELLERIAFSLPEYKRVPQYHPEFIADSVQKNITVLQTADVFVTFVGEGAAYRNVLGFYTYDSGNPPQSIADIEASRTVIFPNSSLAGSGGGLKVGDKVKIGTFHPGTVIGWFLAADGYRNKIPGNGNWVIYSNKNLNPESDTLKKQHNVLLNDLGSGRVILGFEDIRRDMGGCDEDFNDALYYVTANPINSISYEDIVLIDDPVENLVADLSLTKSINNSNPGDGEIVTYTITLTNQGPDNASDVKVSDILPQGLLYKSHTAASGTYDVSTGLWSVPVLGNGASSQLTVKAAVNIAAISQSAFDLGLAVDFNVFVFDDMSQPSSDTEGKMAIGRDGFFSNYSVGDRLPSSGGTEDVMIIGQNLTFVSGSVSGGNVVYGSGSNLPADMVSIIDGTARRDSVIDFEAAEIYFNELSVSLKAYEANGEVEIINSGLVLTGNDPFLNVFSVEGTLLDAAVELSISVPNGAVVLLNISGESMNWNGGHTVSGTAISNVLYNFYDATDLKIQGIDVRGSVLAPKATLDFPSGVINGQVIAKNILGTGQFNSGDNNSTHFIGNIPVSRFISNIAKIIASAQQDPNPGNNSAEITLTLAGFGDPGNTGSGEWDLIGGTAAGEIVWVMEEDFQGDLLAGTWGGKINRSTDNGVSWIQINPGMNAAYIWDILVDEQIIYAATEQGVFKSVNNGADWAITGLAAKDTRALAIAGNVIFAGTWGEGIFRSSDEGATWSSSAKELSGLPVHAMEVDQAGNIFAGTFGSQVLRSKDGGESWEQLNVGYLFIWSLGINSQGHIYAGTYGGGVYRSQNSGEVWYPINENLNASHIYAIRIDDNDNVFVTGWSSGVYVLGPDKSEIWGSLGMGGLGVSSLWLQNGVLYAGAANGRIYSNSSPLTGVEVKASFIPGAIMLEQNYPNPFNPSTNISFTVAEEEKYRLSIYNSIGELVEILADRDFSSGKHNVVFNASSLSTGVYFYTLTGNGVKLNRKMLLVK